LAGHICWYAAKEQVNLHPIIALQVDCTPYTKKKGAQVAGKFWFIFAFKYKQKYPFSMQDLVILLVNIRIYTG
jgi:hypothetical protein